MPVPLEQKPIDKATRGRKVRFPGWMYVLFAIALIAFLLWWLFA
jgi:hypothetical protein